MSVLGATEKSALQVTHLGTVAGEAWGLSCCGFTRPSVGAGLALAGVCLHFTPLACGGGGVRWHTHCLGHRLLPHSRESAQPKLYKMTRLPCGRGLSGCPRSEMPPLAPQPHLCVQADTGSRRRWLESGRLRCRRGGRAGPGTHPRPPHSAVPQSLGGRCSGSLQVCGCTSHGCDRAEIDKRRFPLSSCVHCSLGRTAGKEG